MIRIPRWLFAIMLPVLFFGGCSASVRPLWALLEPVWIRPVTDSEKTDFPVLVRSPSSGFSVAPLDDIPPTSEVVTSDFDETAINRDLNASSGSAEAYEFFRVLQRDSEVTRIRLEVPTRSDFKFRGWYDVRNGQVLPQKTMAYGPGIVFFILPLSVLCGLATTYLFSKFVCARGRDQPAAGT